MTRTNEAVAVVLAAGKSTRMKSDLPKVLHDLCGQPLLAYVLEALEGAGVRRKLVVVGHGASLVERRFAGAPGVEFVLQAEQKGTGHAVLVCEDQFADHPGPTIVLTGDGPMIQSQMIQQMLARCRETQAQAFLATAEVGDPTGLGRIVRDARGNFQRIVEHKDASPEERRIREVNPSFYVFDTRLLLDALRQVRPNNVGGEYYVTDVPAILLERGHCVVAEVLASEADMFSINTRRHLAEAHRLMQERIQGRLMDAGVSIVDPRTTSVDGRAVIGRDTILYPFTVIEGPARIGCGCRLGPFAYVRDGQELPDGAVVRPFQDRALRGGTP